METVAGLLICYGLSFAVLFGLFVFDARQRVRSFRNRVTENTESIARYAVLLEDDSSKQQ